MSFFKNKKSWPRRSWLVENASKTVKIQKNNFQNIFSNNYYNETNLKKIYYETNKHYLEDLIDLPHLWDAATT